MKREEDPASRERLSRLEDELASLQEKSDAMTAAWKAEKDNLANAQKLKEQLDAARNEVVLAQRRGDLARGSQLLYGEIPELAKQIAAAQGGLNMANEAATEAGIPAI